MSNISFLEMGKTKKRGVRESIIEILSREFPLNIRKIYNKVKREYGLDVTYQAVFKTVKEMLEDNVLEEIEKEYKLNINWVKQLENELEIIKKNYLGDESKEEPMQKIANNFVAELGPKIKEYIGKDEACVVGVSSGGGRIIGRSLLKYFLREGLKVNYIEFDKIKAAEGNFILPKKELENRKIIVIDSSISSGETYDLITGTLNKIKKKFQIKEIKYAVERDSLGLADFSINPK